LVPRQRAAPFYRRTRTHTHIPHPHHFKITTPIPKPPSPTNVASFPTEGWLSTTRPTKCIVPSHINDIIGYKDNYIEGNNLVFNSYKTSKTYGQQKVAIPIKLRNILNKWIAINPTDDLLFDANYNPLSSVKLNQRLNKLFDGKKVGINGLRHTYLTDKFGDTIAQKKAVANTMEAMGSSPAMLTTYVKEE
jgi:hypothetical protein